MKSGVSVESWCNLVHFQKLATAFKQMYVPSLWQIHFVGGWASSFAGIVKCRTSYQQKNDSVYVMMLLFFYSN